MITPDKRTALIQERQLHLRTKGCRVTSLLDHRCEWCQEVDKQLSIDSAGWFLTDADRRMLKGFRIALS